MQFLNKKNGDILDIGHLARLTRCSVPRLDEKKLKELKKDFPDFKDIYIITNQDIPESTDNFNYVHNKKYRYDGVLAVTVWDTVKKDFNEKTADVLNARAQEYPDIGNQLDAIMKWLATKEESTMTKELKSIAMHCMSVKAKHPKPIDQSVADSDRRPNQQDLEK